jgi:hypothetical protein
MNLLANLSVIAGAISLVSLLALHFTSPEFQPGWRMISEYALGKYKWLLSLFFYAWGAGSLLLAAALVKEVDGFWPFFGVALLALSGIGAIAGGLFDVNHRYHGMAFALGVPTLPVAALLLSYHLSASGSKQSDGMLLTAHATWISLLLMAISMFLMFSGFKKAGIRWEKDAPPPDRVPPGVIALGGYANRLLVFCYIFWAIYVAWLLTDQ